MENEQNLNLLSAPVAQALDCVAAENYLQAREILRPLIKACPQEDELIRLYHYCLTEADKQSERLLEKDFLESSVDEDPNWANAYQLAEKKEYEKAAQAFEKLADESAQAHHLGLQTQALYQQAVCYYLLGQKEKAAQTYRQYKTLSEQSSVWGPHMRVYHLMAAQNYREALDLLDKEISKDPNNGTNYLTRARLFDKINLTDRALEDRQTARGCFEADTQTRPFSSWLYDSIARVCEELGDFSAALAANAKAIALWPQNLDYHVLRVCLLVKSGQGRAAVLYRRETCEGVFSREYKKDVAAQGKICEAFENYERAAYFYQIGPIDSGRYRALKRVFEKMNYPEKIKEIESKMARAASFKDRVCEPMLAYLLEKNVLKG